VVAVAYLSDRLRKIGRTSVLFVLTPANPCRGTYSGSTHSEQNQTHWLGNANRPTGVSLKRQDYPCDKKTHKESRTFKKLHDDSSAVEVLYECQACFYLPLRRRMSSAALNPARPVPSSIRLIGSGTDGT
jgi:hypothetical protein